MTTTIAAPRRKTKKAAAVPPRRATKKGAVAAPRRTVKKEAIAAPTELALHTSRNTLAANPLVGIRRKEVLATASALLAKLARQPRAVSKQYGKFLGELLRVATGRSTIAPVAGDRRFVVAGH